MSVVEMVVYISIFTIVTIALFNSINFFYRTNRYTLEQSTQVDVARRGVTLMVENIREADYSDNGIFPIVSAGANSFSFFSNTDADTGVEKVRFFLDGTTFKKGVINPEGNPVVYTGTEAVSSISQYVRNGENDMPIFKYYDNTGTQITDYSQLAKIAFVEVNLVVNINPVTLPNEFNLRSSATIRNLKNNL